MIKLHEVKANIKDWIKNVGFPKDHIIFAKNQLSLLQAAMLDDPLNKDLNLKREASQNQTQPFLSIEESQVRQKSKVQRTR